MRICDRRAVEPSLELNVSVSLTPSRRPVETDQQRPSCSRSAGPVSTTSCETIALSDVCSPSGFKVISLSSRSHPVYLESCRSNKDDPNGYLFDVRFLRRAYLVFSRGDRLELHLLHSKSLRLPPSIRPTALDSVRTIFIHSARPMQSLHLPL